MKKVFSLTLMALGLALITHRGEATVGVRAPKESFSTNYTVNPSTAATPLTVAQSTAGVTEPGAVYQVIMTSGTTGDFLVLFDSNAASGLSSTTISPAPLSGRLLHGSTTQTTVITFDPPLIFYKGLVAVESNALNSSVVSYELGRGLQGN